MSTLDNVLSLSKKLHKLEKQSRYLWASFSSHRASDDFTEASASWVDLTRTQYAIAATLDAIHAATKNSYHSHIYKSVDSLESATGVYKHMPKVK